jgi:hypothetical protein
VHSNGLGSDGEAQTVALFLAFVARDLDKRLKDRFEGSLRDTGAAVTDINENE